MNNFIKYFKIIIKIYPVTTVAAIAVFSIFVGGGIVNFFSGGDCPKNAVSLRFNKSGIVEPVPQIQAEPQIYCFDLIRYKSLMAATGETETGREINGLDWLAESIAFPDRQTMLEEIKTALQNIHTSQKGAAVGWIELPGYNNK